MNKLLITATLLLWLSGCQIPVPAPEPGPTLFTDAEIDLVTDRGIAYINEGPDVLSAEEIDSDYASVERCLGMTADPYDLTVVHSDRAANYTDTNGGLLVTPYQSFLLLTPYTFDEYWSKHYTRILMRHEMVHYILLKATGDGDVEHDSGLFAGCMYI